MYSAARPAEFEQAVADRHSCESTATNSTLREKFGLSSPHSTLGVDTVTDTLTGDSLHESHFALPRLLDSRRSSEFTVETTKEAADDEEMKGTELRFKPAAEPERMPLDGHGLPTFRGRLLTSEGDYMATVSLEMDGFVAIARNGSAQKVVCVPTTVVDWDEADPCTVHIQYAYPIWSAKLVLSTQREALKLRHLLRQTAETVVSSLHIRTPPGYTPSGRAPSWMETERPNMHPLGRFIHADYVVHSTLEEPQSGSRATEVPVFQLYWASLHAADTGAATFTFYPHHDAGESRKQFQKCVSMETKPESVSLNHNVMKFQGRVAGNGGPLFHHFIIFRNSEDAKDWCTKTLASQRLLTNPPPQQEWQQAPPAYMPTAPLLLEEYRVYQKPVHKEDFMTRGEMDRDAYRREMARFIAELGNGDAPSTRHSNLSGTTTYNF